MVAESGAQLDHVTRSMKEAKTQTKDIPSPEHVIIHLGTCDVTHKDRSGARITAKCCKAIEELKTAYPDATVSFCSILPRKGNSNYVLDCNYISQSINEFLEMFCNDKKEKMAYIDTHKQLTASNGHTIRRYYNANDNSGVHFNDVGKKTILKYIMSVINKDDNKRKLSATSPNAEERTCKGARISTSPAESSRTPATNHILPLNQPLLTPTLVVGHREALRKAVLTTDVKTVMLTNVTVTINM